MSTQSNSYVMAKFSDIVHPGYSSANSINLRIDMEDGITLDDNNQVIFLMEKHFSHGCRRVLLDASSKSVCIMHKKKGTAHGRWEVYRGDTSQVSFIVKKASLISSTESIDLDVFLPNNTEESVCKLKASCNKNSCQIYTADGSILANAKGFMENKNAMEVKIEADVDHAFIVALLAIVDEKKKKIETLKKVGDVMMTATSAAITTSSLIVGILQLFDN